MSDLRKRLEDIVGGKIEQEGARAIPGVLPIEGQQVIYFSDDGNNSLRKQFSAITCFVDPPNAKCGGVNDRGCQIVPPNGPAFYAISYHGDLDGWRRDIEAGAKGLGLLLACIENEKFVISTGESIPLKDCKIAFL